MEYVIEKVKWVVKNDPIVDMLGKAGGGGKPEKRAHSQIRC